MRRFFEGVNKKEAISWALYDFANSSYSLLILSFVFPIFYKEAIAGPKVGDLYWGLITSLSILLGGLASPVIGAMADHDARRKSKWVVFALAAMAATGALYWSGPGLLFFASAAFMAANFFFEVAQTLYDSFLMHVSSPQTAGRISGLGWGLGYLGGVLAMLAFRPLYAEGFAGPHEPLYKLTFLATALFFFVFSLPAFLFIRERPAARHRPSWPALLRIGMRNVAVSLRKIRAHRTIAWFLLAFFLMNDALVTLFAFISIYAHDTLGLSVGEIIPLFILIQVLAFPCTLAAGWLSDRHGGRKFLLIALGVWVFITGGLAAAASKPVFYALGILTAFVIGSSQAIARAWLSKMIPLERRCEFFGFNGFASKVAATIGPVLFGGISVLTGSQRLAMLGLLPFFVAALVIFFRIPEAPTGSASA